MFKKIEKAELLEILKRNNFSGEKAEEILEMIGEGLGDSILDIVSLVISKLENETAKTVASMAYGSIEPKAREAVDNIKVSL
jgi:hypothetical protein